MLEGQGDLDEAGGARGRVAVTTFASNVGRLRAVALAAKAADRQLVVVGRAMFRTLNAARETGYIDDIGEVLSERDYGYLPPDKVVCLCTGSQGEPMSALHAIQRSLLHIAQHVGQIVLLAKHYRGEEWETLSIPRAK